MTNKQTVNIKRETDVAEQDTPAVLAYRVGQLEKQQAEGFATLNAKLDSMTSNFATVSQLFAEKALSEQSHEEFNKRIISLEDDRKWVQRSIGERLINWVATAAVAAYALFKG